MQFGLFLTMPAPEPRPAAELYGRALDMARAADEQGFSHLWLAEHHFTNYAHTSRPLMLLAHIVAHTRRLRVGPAIIPLPMHHPLTVAEELATLDALSGGRVEVGLDKGYQRYQYERFQIEKGATAERDDEALDVLLAALREPVFRYSGRHFRIPDTHLVPQPAQRAMPLWMVVNSSRRESIEQAVRRRANMSTGALEPISKLTDMRAAWPDLAGAMTSLRIGTQRPVYVAQSHAEALEAAEQARWNGRATWRLRHEHGAVIGTVDECLHQLCRIRDGPGCDYFSASFWFGALTHSQVMTSMQRFAQCVIPAMGARPREATACAAA